MRKELLSKYGLIPTLPGNFSYSYETLNIRTGYVIIKIHFLVSSGFLTMPSRS